jgi:hypothetical protein
MVARQVLYCFLKTAASPFAGLVKDIVPAFKAEAAPAAAGIMKVPNPATVAVKSGLMNRIQRPMGLGQRPGVPRIVSDPALEAKSVFKNPGVPAPAAPIVNKPSPEYRPQPAPAAVSTDVERMQGEERDLASRVSDPTINPAIKVDLQARLKKLYEQLSTGPALQMANPAGHDAAQAARIEKVQQQREQLRAQMQREAQMPTNTVPRGFPPETTAVAARSPFF